MTIAKILSPLLLACALFVAPASAGVDVSIERMLLCKDSWLDWQKANDPRLQQLAAQFQSGYTQKEGDAFFVPKTATSIAGFRVLQFYPGSVGMGVGISVLVDAPFDKVRQSLEHTLGKPLTKCETGDGMKSCELQFAEQRTFTLMSGDDPKTKSTLLGCYYYYEK